MVRIWSPQHRYALWRRLWLALAEAQHELGLTGPDGVTPRIRAEQLEAMRRHLDDIDLERVAEYERRVRHDVMAHIQAFAEVCPEARDIIHLGATSCYVTDNADIVLMRESLAWLRERLAACIRELARFARRWRDLPTLGSTHYQPAQLTTVGKRACLWLYDLVLDYHELDRRHHELRLRGVKGTTGTQASFLLLFGGDHEKVRQLERRVAQKMGFERVHPVTGQTYTRKADLQVLQTLAGIGVSAHKFGTDLRLLQHDGELEEPSESEQVGSSAMPHKKNPMRAERLCSLARYLLGLPEMLAHTAATQWLERTLDDSAVRRLVLPQAFLCADAVLRLYHNIVAGLVVHEPAIRRRVAEYLPFLAAEPLLMRAVRQGGDRQMLHELLRRHCRAVAERMHSGADNDLLARLRREPAFAQVEFADLADPKTFLGRAPEQVDEFLLSEVDPIVQKHAGGTTPDHQLQV